MYLFSHCGIMYFEKILYTQALLIIRSIAQVSLMKYVQVFHCVHHTEQPKRHGQME